MSPQALATGRTEELMRRAAGLFPGGVNSPVRTFAAVGRPPIAVVRGEGAWVWDADGRRYLDLIGTWGATIAGHGHPAVRRAIERQLEHGLAFGTTHPLEVELAEQISQAMPGIERLRFTSSGTEAVMSALRLARAATGRELIVKFSGAYHGHVDGLLVEAGSGVATLGLPGSAGVPRGVARQTIVLPFNDVAALDAAFTQHGERIAAVITEPVIANSGVIAPQPGFLEALRATTQRHGALLIFDEVITGFRLGRGGAQERFGIRPDLTTLGKVIGGGLPIGAYGGPAALMAHVAPSGPMYQAGTLAGHPLAMAAGLAVLELLVGQAYVELEQRVARFAGRLEQLCAGAPMPVSLARVGPLMTLFFAAQPPADGAQAQAADRTAYGRFFGHLLDAGVLLPPSQFEAWFPGLAHGDEELELLLEAVRGALGAAE